ncbi:MAG: hypothetical protein H6622_01640 [Halobacteriovoraceae bacterium]|nr:hypothetical protein [Halobacteriovoraceae bacterium]
MIKVILALFFTNVAMAYINLEISITHRKGIDKGLTLVSELHSLEVMDNEKGLDLVMKDGHRFHFNSQFSENNGDYGPTANIDLTVQLFDTDGGHIHTYSGEQMKISLGEKKKITYESEGQLVEVLIRPFILP